MEAPKYALMIESTTKSILNFMALNLPVVQGEDPTPSSAQKFLPKEDNLELEDMPIAETVANPPSSPEAKKPQAEPQLSPVMEEALQTEHPMSGRPLILDPLPEDKKEQVRKHSVSQDGKFKDQPRMTSTGQIQMQVQLTWKDLVVVPKDQIHLSADKSKNDGNAPGVVAVKQKLILNHVSGTVMPQQFLAIIGASGNSQEGSGRGRQDHTAELLERQDVPCRPSSYWNHDNKRDPTRSNRLFQVHGVRAAGRHSL